LVKGYAGGDTGRSPEDLINWHDRLVQEVRLTLTAYSRQSLAPAVTHLVFVSDISSFSRLRMRVERLLGISAEQVDLFKGIAWAKEVDESQVKELVPGVSAATVLAGTQPNPAMTLNLLPEEGRSAVHGAQQRRQWLATGLVVLGIVVALGAVGAVHFLEYQDQQALVATRLGESRPQARELESISKELDIMRRALSRRHTGLTVLSELYQAVPPGVSLSQLSYEQEKVLSLRGTTDRLSVVFDVQAALEKSELFEKVEIKFASMKKRKGAEVAEFQIDCPLKGL